MNTFTKQLLGLAMVGMILGGCSQTATYEDADLTNELAAAEKAGFKLNPFNVGGNENAALADCSDCITEPQVETKVISKVTGNPQNPTVTRQGEFSVYNTPTDIVLEYHFYGTDGADGMSVSINGTNYLWSKDGAKDPAYTNVTLAGNNKIISFKITQALDSKEACTIYPTTVAYSGGPGGSLTANLDYAIYEYCTEECDESFTWKDNKNGTYTFTYIPSEDIADAELVLTFAQNSVKAAQDGWSPNGQTYQKTMDLEKCEVYTWTFTLDCKDLNNPQNLWTDFKVDNVSKKGTLSNIKCN